ncbi:hypothetical protein [Aureibacter tunicatorum]|uniref:Immunity protein 50 n=1 Tax=Aureibacter tunicatorum TaxID=866807 RepID=A0AAE3XTB7_9BACT|nr:hypothetical protein [Aureibacter tunicatorum]MDR6241486.1 hypothetical protein [Aureibacter tunicatorum]BDD06671.1 hypothetical protein AUTU_41540 [Aureibacter tunicatorum]
MIEEKLAVIVEQFDSFADAVLVNLIFDNNYKDYPVEKDNIRLKFRCLIKSNNYKYGVVELNFQEVVFFKFVQEFPDSTCVVDKALINHCKGEITFDFFPSLSSERVLIENDDSCFKIKCRNIDYSVIKFEVNELGY